MIRFDINPDRTALVIMAFGFAEVTAVDQVLGRLPVAASA